MIETNVLIINLWDNVTYHAQRYRVSPQVMFDIYEIIMYSRLEMYEYSAGDWKCDGFVGDELTFHILVIENMKEQFSASNHPILQFSHAIIQRYVEELIRDLPEVLFEFIDQHAHANIDSAPLWNHITIRQHSSLFVLTHLHR